MRYRYFIIPMLMIALLGLVMTVSCARLRNIKASISGTVYMDGRPISGHLLLKDTNGNVVGRADTSLSGHYQIKDINAGTYKLMFLNMQGVPWGGEVTVVVRLGRPEGVDLQLKSSDRLPISEYGGSQ